MDRAFGTIINGAFYFFLACVILAALGVNPLVLFASVSSFFVGFAFMVGFEDWLTSMFFPGAC